MHAAFEKWGGDIVDKVTAALTDAFRREVADLRLLIGATETQIQGEIREQAKHTQEQVITRVEGMLDDYKGLPKRVHDLERHELAKRVDALDEARLPQRVSALEAKVFAPKRRATAARRKRS